MGRKNKVKTKDKTLFKEIPRTVEIKKKRKKSDLAFLGGAVILGVLVALSLFLFLPGLRVRDFSERRELVFGEAYNDEFGEICFGNYFSCEEVEIEGFGDQVNEKKIGNYHRGIKVFYGDGEERDFFQTISIIDRKAPEIKIEQDSVFVCPNGRIPDFGLEVFDDYDGEIKEGIEKKFEDGQVVIAVRDSSGNYAEKIISGIVEDKVAPDIDLNGAEKYEMTLDMIYEIPTPTVLDNCDEVELKTRGEVDYRKVGTYKLDYEAVDESGNIAQKTRTVVIKETPDRGIIYLTFDDGPGEFTDKLLDVLKKNNVKATFFVTGFGEDRLIKRAFDEGHTIGLHTFTHDYSYVYKNMNNYFDDLNKVQERVKRITGKETYLIRFPGGSSNTVSKNYDGGVKIMSKLVEEVTKRGYVYFDWNISSGDAGSVTSSASVYKNVIDGLGKGGSYVVLQHDVKGYSVDAVERIIKYGKEHGYRFLPLDKSSFTAHHGVNN